VKIALVQINPVIGDFDRNCEKIRLWSEKARTRGCDLVIFPELVVSGYPPQDLLERNSFLAAHDEAVASLLAHLPEIDTMFGCLERRDGRRGKPLHNSSAVARQGRVIFRARKQLLPAYDVFDESRYFEPGSPSDFYQVKGLTFGVTVCEDVWSEEVNEYDVDPVADIFSKAKAQGVTIDGIINISASPFQRDKEKIRKGIFEKICRSNNVPFFYCNQVGGQDSLLFDGRSLVMDATGTVVAQAKGFCEDMIVVDTDTWQGDMNEAVRISEQAAVYQGLVMGVGLLPEMRFFLGGPRAFRRN